MDLKGAYIVMLNATLIDTKLIKSEYQYNFDASASKEININLNISVTHSKSLEKGRKFKIYTDINYGDENSTVHIRLTTGNTFEVESCDNEELSNDELSKICFPPVMKQMRKYFDSLTKIYGLENAQLPMFDFEV